MLDYISGFDGITVARETATRLGLVPHLNAGAFQRELEAARAELRRLQGRIARSPWVVPVSEALSPRNHESFLSRLLDDDPFRDICVWRATGLDIHVR